MGFLIALFVVTSYVLIGLLTAKFIWWFTRDGGWFGHVDRIDRDIAFFWLSVLWPLGIAYGIIHTVLWSLFSRKSTHQITTSLHKFTKGNIE
jgi:hypothetical protein